MKIVSAAVVAFVLALFATGCGQYYAGPDCSTAVLNPDPKCSFTVESPIYQVIPYSVMHSTLTDVLLAPVEKDSDPTDDPLHYPMAYLNSHRFELGAPDYENGIPPQPITTGGFKAWVLASSSACGLMVQKHPEVYDGLFVALLARQPTQVDRDLITKINQEFPDPARAKAAVCTTILSSLEFMDAN